MTTPKETHEIGPGGSIMKGLNEAIEHAEGKRTLRTSVESLKKLDRETRQKAILAVIAKRQMTAREIAYKLGYRDLNSVRPRITELVQDGRLIEAGQKYDKYSDRNVTVYKAAP